MAVLLDTQAFLWWVMDDARLSKGGARAIAAGECLVSIASCWEMAIEASLGKLSLAVSVEKFVQEQLEVNGFNLLPVTLEHVGGVVDLPFHHRDPFDRLLVAQCRAEELAVVSSDRVFSRYGVKRFW
jgi:PIN domain nuclease of toxin-antitoxin system